jgi:ribosome biogenesis protein NSA1
MPRFLAGDELGNIKSFKYAPSSKAESRVTVATLYDGSGKGKERAVQKLAVHSSGDGHGPLVRQVNPRHVCSHTKVLE